MAGAEWLMDLGLTWLGSPEGASKDTGEAETDTGDIQIGKTEKRVHSTLASAKFVRDVSIFC